jgi:sodium-dependent dicarboxylate transporter 2/3/5
MVGPSISFFGKWLIGPLGAVLVSALGIPGLNTQQTLLTAVMVWVAAWWISQPIPLGMIGILGVCLTVVLGIAEPAVAFAGFSHKVVFLLLGTFFLAQAMHVHDVNRFLCSKLVSQRFLASRPRLALAAFIGLVGVMSWWFSATAETVMLIPIGLAIFAGIDRVLPLGIAYASLLGGIVFPLGSNQNILAIALLEQQAVAKVDFFSWMKTSFPIWVLCFGILWFVLFRNRKLSFHPITAASKATVAQKRVLGVFAVLVALWFLPGLIKTFIGADHFLIKWLDNHLPESVSALLLATLLFMVPSNSKNEKGRALLTWKDAQEIDWNVLLLVGAGLSLSGVIFKTGLASTIGTGIVHAAGPNATEFFICLCVLLPTFIITSFASNTATGDLMLPIAISVAQQTGMSPVVLAMAVAWTASLGFTIPAATPSVAVALNSGAVTRKDLTRNGIAMDLLCFGAVLLVVAFFTLGTKR